MEQSLVYAEDRPTGDELLNVTFYELVEDGVPVEYINIRCPGDPTLDFHSVLGDDYKARFARRYEAYKSMRGEGGTPLEDWDELTPNARRDFSYLGFQTVEQIAFAPDSAFSRVMGGISLRLRAQAFLNRGKVSQEETIKRQEQRIADLEAKLTAVLESIPSKLQKKRTEESEAA